jgi:uncharacterized RDD family membrane protein YckC
MNPNKKTAQLGIAFCIIGILSCIGLRFFISADGFLSFNNSPFRRLLWAFLSTLRPVNFPDFTVGLQFETMATIVLQLFFLIGCIRLLYKQESYGLAGFFFSIVLFENVVSILFRIIFLLSFGKSSRFEWLDIVQAMIAFGISIGYIALSKKALDNINSTTSLITNSYGQGNELVVSYQEASPSARFAHNIVDRLVIIFIPIKFIFNFFYIKSFIDSSTSYTKDDPFDLQLKIYVLLILSFAAYYMFYEALLSKTPAKYLTKTRVALYDGSKPSFETILKRTMCRLVPFDAFSFLWNGKWHDSWSSTYVLDESNKAEEIIFDYERNQEV